LLGFYSIIDFNKENEVKWPIGADPRYLVWCIDNIENFFINPNDLELMEKLKITILKGVNVIYKGDSLYEYSLSTLSKTFSFTDDIKRKNLLKYDSIFTKNNYKSRENNWEDDWTQEDLESADWDYNYNNPAHNPSQNPWIDVFGPGDEAETAYWNTD
jgi:hypothetical protein